MYFTSHDACIKFSACQEMHISSDYGHRILEVFVHCHMVLKGSPIPVPWIDYILYYIIYTSV